jgi:ABC-type dipeptide/oligopeptide/nickel transport system ATPase component
MEDKRRASLSSLLFVSHDLDVISWMCDAIVVMYRGRIVETGATAEVLRAPKHPYTRMLAESSRALRRRGVDDDALLLARSDFAAFRASADAEGENE